MHLKITTTAVPLDSYVILTKKYLHNI